MTMVTVPEFSEISAISSEKSFWNIEGKVIRLWRVSDFNRNSLPFSTINVVLPEVFRHISNFLCVKEESMESQSIEKWFPCIWGLSIPQKSRHFYGGSVAMFFSPMINFDGELYICRYGGMNTIDM